MIHSSGRKSCEYVEYIGTTNNCLLKIKSNSENVSGVNINEILKANLKADNEVGVNINLPKKVAERKLSPVTRIEWPHVHQDCGLFRQPFDIHFPSLREIVLVN